jgi:GTP cyclohydrolase IB
MADDSRFLVDVGMRDLPFPMTVISRDEPAGQPTVASISINARIMQDFEARWIDRFIQIVHDHRERIGPQTLDQNILEYLEALKAATVRIDFEFPFFIEKSTPVTASKCLVRYMCTYAAKVSSLNSEPKVIVRCQVPCITTYPISHPDHPGGLFGQLSTVDIEIETHADIYPQDLVDLVDEHAVAPVYSFLAEEDQIEIIHRIHSVHRTSVETTDGIRQALARNKLVDWYSVRCTNFGMLHSYSTVIGTEKSTWVPFSGYESEV